MSRADDFHAPPPSGPILNLRAQANYLLHEWGLMFRGRTLLADALSAIAVALIALPLSLAIANASLVTPQIGLVTAVVGGIVAALFGGCRLQVSGPAAAMTFLVSEIVTKHGMNGLIAAVLVAGALQVLSGLFRIGRFMQFIPRPVVAGFLTGIGITILCTQLPKILGYDVTHDDEGGALSLLWQTMTKLGNTGMTSLVVGLTATASMFLVPRISRRLPAPLIAVSAATLLPFIFGWTDVALLGRLPSGFPRPSLPPIPWYEWNEVFMVGLTIYFIASIESLLSASVVDSMAKETRVDNDQELLGQGLANIASSLFGGIPVTGVIARSATNIQAGARTRLSAILHALIILLMMLSLGPLVARIPIAALAGVLIAVAFRMIEIRMLRALWHGSRMEATVYLVTAASIVVSDLIVGVQVGMVAAFVYFVSEMSRLNVESVALHDAPTPESDEPESTCPTTTILRIEGPLFFASGFHLRNLVSRIRGYRTVILDMVDVPFLDITGAEILEESIELLKRRKVEVLLARLSPSVQKRLAGLTQAELHTLRHCPIYPDLRDAMLHAATLVQPGDLCARCKDKGRCTGLDSMLSEVEPGARTRVPRVRAVVRASGEHDWNVEDTRDDALSTLHLADSNAPAIRPAPDSPAGKSTPPTIHASARIDPRASVIGAVTLGENVYVGPGASLRADEGSPFYIGPGSSLQDGVTLHALRDKVVLVQGRPYAIFLGANVTVTHHALIHGPCFIGDGCFLGYKSIVHDSLLGEGCVLGLGAVVVGVSIPPGRYIAHTQLVDTQQKADNLPTVDATITPLNPDPNNSSLPTAWESALTSATSPDPAPHPTNTLSIRRNNLSPDQP